METEVTASTSIDKNERDERRFLAMETTNLCIIERHLIHLKIVQV